MNNLQLKILLSLALLVGATNVLAKDPDASRWQLGVAFGYGERTNPLVDSDNVEILVDVDLAWFGDRFFFDSGDFGLTLADSRRATINAIVRVNSDRVFFSRANTRFISVGDAQAGEPPVEPTIEPLPPPDRDYAVEAGVEVLTDGLWGYLHASAFHDVSTTHEGFELRATYGRSFVRKRWFFEPSVGVRFVSAKMNDYYWGVRTDETALMRPAYTADDAVNFSARFKATYFVTDRWSLGLAADYERLDTATTDSPIVDASSVFGFFAGMAYRW